MGGGREWEVVSEEELAKYGVFRVQRRRARSPRTGEVHEFHLIQPPASVIVIAVTSEDRLVMVEQYRHGPQRVMLEFAAGIIDDGEDVLAAALRELEEETGYRTTAAEPIGRFHTDPAIQRNMVTVVVAHGCAQDGSRDQDAGEDVGVRLVTRAELLELMREGVQSAPALAAWQLYEQWRARSA